MSELDIEKIVIEQGHAAAQRQSQLRRMLIGSFFYITVMATIFAGIITFQTRTIDEQTKTIQEQTETIKNQTHTINELSGILDRRSPILEYLQCHNELVNDRNRLQTNFVFNYIDANGDTPTIPPSVVSESKELYEQAEDNLTQLKGCPEFPN